MGHRTLAVWIVVLVCWLTLAPVSIAQAPPAPGPAPVSPMPPVTPGGPAQPGFLAPTTQPPPAALPWVVAFFCAVGVLLIVCMPSRKA